MAYRSFEDLEVWKRACRLAVMVYDALQGCKDYGLKDQMTRAAFLSPRMLLKEQSEAQDQISFVSFTLPKAQPLNLERKSILPRRLEF